MTDQGTQYRVVRVLHGDSAPSLEPARQRVELAADRLAELETAVGALCAAAATQPLRIAFDRKLLDSTGQFSAPRLLWSNDVPRPNDIFRVRMLAGEYLFHLRTALEYVAYHLVWLDTGSIFEKSQFPVVHRRGSDKNIEKVWKDSCSRNVPGLSSQHQSMLRDLQPFTGCEWLGQLASLNNQDKHRGVLKLQINDTAGLPADGATLDLRPSEDAPDDWYEVDRPGGVRVDVVMEDGASALPVLRGFVQPVVDFINAISAGHPNDL